MLPPSPVQRQERRAQTDNSVRPCVSCGYRTDWGPFCDQSKTTSTAVRPIPDDALEDQPQTRLRAFLSKVRPLSGCTGNEDVFWEGRSLIDRLALAYEIKDVNDYEWALAQCATVLGFLQAIEPVKGHCFCGGFDRETVSITCGHHLILQHIEDQLLRMGTQVKRRKRQEVAYG